MLDPPRNGLFSPGDTKDEMKANGSVISDGLLDLQSEMKRFRERLQTSADRLALEQSVAARDLLTSIERRLESQVAMVRADRSCPSSGSKDNPPALDKPEIDKSVSSSLGKLITAPPPNSNDSAFLNAKGLKSSKLAKKKSRLEVLAEVQQERAENSCSHRVLTWCIIWAEWFYTLEEPERTGCLNRFVQSKPFEMTCIAFIMCNALFLVYTTDYDLAHIGGDPTPFMIGIELAFMLFYMVELTLKLMVHRLFFFWNAEWRWNLLDFMLVTFSIMETSVLWGKESAGLNLSFMRSVRLFKLAKILRVFRSLRFFTELRLMLDCVVGSFLNLIWCLIMIVFVLYMFALLITQGLLAEIEKDPNRHDKIEEAMLTFGSVGDAMITLWMSTTGGVDWGEQYDMLKSWGSFMSFALLFYVLFFTIAVWNIITSTFVEKSLKIAQPDVETLALEQSVKDMVDAEGLQELFSEMDVDGSATISLEEFEALSHHPKFQSLLAVRGIDIKNASVFYDMLRNALGDEEDVELGSLVNACLRMKGFATSIDLHSLSFETKKLCTRQQKQAEQFIAMMKRLENSVDSVLCFVRRSPSATSDDSCGKRPLTL